MGKELADLEILDVDDEASITRLVRMMLIDLGVTQIFTARDGREALDFLGGFDDLIDLVICDWNMPKVTGLEVLQQIRTVDPDAPFLMLPGRADQDSVIAARDHGVSDYLLKPFSPEQLHAKLQGIVKRSHLAA